MLKLLDTYRAAPTLENAKRVFAHVIKHPFSACLLQADDIVTLNTAVKHARGLVSA